MNPKTAYKKMKAIAKERGISIRKHCLDCGVHPSTVAQWKKNTKAIKLETLEKLFKIKVTL